MILNKYDKFYINLFLPGITNCERVLQEKEFSQEYADVTRLILQLERCLEKNRYWDLYW